MVRLMGVVEPQREVVRKLCPSSVKWNPTVWITTAAAEAAASLS